MIVLPCLVGPTAAGKSKMAVDVALDLVAAGHRPEIVSCDSMGVYRELDIVADKPNAEERRGISHHLFDIVSPSEDFTAARFRERARAVIEEIHGRGGVPMLVGGSGLYFRAVVDDLEFAPADPGVRARLAEEDPSELLDRLRQIDPETAGRLDPANARRIVRAAEIAEVSGRPPSEFRRSWERFEGPYETVVAGLVWDNETLFERATLRVQRELDAGLLDEVRRVGTFSRTARQALGVKEMIPVIEGEATIETATAELVRNTKNFIRRQRSWFRSDPRVRWFDASELSYEGARAEIAKFFLDRL